MSVWLALQKLAAIQYPGKTETMGMLLVRV